MFLLKREVWGNWRILYSTLHSTMFLLKLSSVNHHFGSIAPLHSTIFLLKHATSAFIVLMFMSFTFHNVSIKTKTEWIRHICFKTLHSTMFLLKREWIRETVPGTEALHSTMFLLKLDSGRDYIHDENPFTFHNVSIKAKPGLVERRVIPTLHSTMFLLKPDYRDRMKAEYLPLHSTMFLLKPPRPFPDRWWWKVLYIPQCFY